MYVVYNQNWSVNTANPRMTWVWTAQTHDTPLLFSKHTGGPCTPRLCTCGSEGQLHALFYAILHNIHGFDTRAHAGTNPPEILRDDCIIVKFLGSQSHTPVFDFVGVGTPIPHGVWGSTVYNSVCAAVTGHYLLSTSSGPRASCPTWSSPPCCEQAPLCSIHRWETWASGVREAKELAEDHMLSDTAKPQRCLTP